MIDYYEIGDQLDLEEESYIEIYHNPIDVKSTIMLSMLKEIEEEYPKLNFIIYQDYDFKKYGEIVAPTVKVVCCGTVIFKATGVVPKDIMLYKIKSIIEML